MGLRWLCQSVLARGDGAGSTERRNAEQDRAGDGAPVTGSGTSNPLVVVENVQLVCTRRLTPARYPHTGLHVGRCRCHRLAPATALPSPPPRLPPGVSRLLVPPGYKEDQSRAQGNI